MNPLRILLLSVVNIYTAVAQNLFEGNCSKVENKDACINIGSVYYNTSTLKVESFTDSSLNNTARISRWLSLDPLSKIYSSHSPYTYVLDNPILFIDPDGK